MTKHNITLKNSDFIVSNSVLLAIKKSNINFETQSRQGKQTYILNDSALLFMTVNPTKTKTHFYLKIEDSAKLRISKHLFEFLSLHLQPQNIEKKEKTKTLALPVIKPDSPKQMIKTPLNWVGNKSKICAEVFSTIPKTISNYHEPFLGSGSVLLYVLQQLFNGNITIQNNIIASDYNKDLINFFKILQQSPVDLYMVLESNFILHYNNCKDLEAKKKFYNEVRASFNLNLGVYCIKQSARFLFLNKTSYAGMFRVNSKGFFNVPFGNRISPAFPSLMFLVNISKLIENVCFLWQKFDPMMRLQPGSFLYLDPPYLKINNNSFVNYVTSGFSCEDSFLLLNFCEKLGKNSCFFTMSNSKKMDQFVKNYKIIKYCSKSISGNLDQLLITNCHKTLV